MPAGDLRARAARLPRRPGAYVFRDARGKVLYVGKARDLRHRVTSYFRRENALDPKTGAMIRQASALEFLVTASEPEALLLEMNLVKEHRPRYNVRLRDDKRFPFIKVTTAEEVPRAFVTRRVLADGNRYFGPYTDAAAMRRTLAALQRAFGVRSCRLRLPGERRRRACLDYYIGRCLGPCVPHCGEEEYAQQVRGLCEALDGRAGDLERAFEARMMEAARDRRYEDAARHRDRLRALARVRGKQAVTAGDGRKGEDRDVVAVVGGGGKAAAHLLRVRAGKVLGQSHFALDPGIARQPGEWLSGFLQEFYRRSGEVPPELLVNCQPPDAAALRGWLAERRGGAVRMVVPRRGGKARLVRLAEENARLHFGQAGAGLAEAAAMEELQAIAGLAQLPARVECVDISTSHGREPVGSVVTMLAGLPARGEYRRYRVAPRGEADDFAMMGEVVERRYRRRRDEAAELPDLLVVDGGPGQLGAALAALRRLELAIPAIALAKREEEIYLAGRPEPLALRPDSAGLRALMRLRDEAHRFAVTYHRSLRTRRTLRTALEGISGLGPARRRALLASFGSPARVAGASPEELARVPGIGPSLARRIHRSLAADPA